MVDTPVWLLVLDGANKAVASAAFLVGGIWAYYKFIRGRVYRPRLEPTIAVRAFQRTAPYLVASISLKNVGTSKVECKQEGSALRVFCTPLRVEALPGSRSPSVTALLCQLDAPSSFVIHTV
jgi:hypothetical protein